MKIIDILVKKANGTLKDGFKFKWNSYTYTYNKKDRFEDEDGDSLSECGFVEYFLNDEVEIIEENKDIEEFKTEYTMRQIDKQFESKINELVRAVNKLNKEREENNNEDVL